MYDESKTVALILAELEPDEALTVGFGESGEHELSPEEQLHAVAGELVDAVQCGDVAAVAEALRGAFLLLDSMPHVEGEHVDEQAEELEPEEQGHEGEPVSHELREALGGGHDNDDEYAFGGKAARKRYSSGGRARYSGGGRVRYADGGMVAPTGPTAPARNPPAPSNAGGAPPGAAWMRELSTATRQPAPTLTGGQQAGSGRMGQLLANRQPMR